MSIRGLLASMPQIIVGNPKPTPKCQKLPLFKQQSLEAKLIRDLSGWGKNDYCEEVV